jgi:putative DNA primase/helicase
LNARTSAYEAATAAVDALALDAGPDSANDATHHDLASGWIKKYAVGEHMPVHSGGTFHMPSADDLWHPMGMEKAQVLIATIYNGRKYCKKNGDYRQIADHAAAVADEPEFFKHAAMGVATPKGFWTIDEKGCCAVMPLSLGHRQQFRLAWEPDFEAEAPRFDAMLALAFEGDHAADQIDLLEQIAGAALFGLMPKYQVAAMLLGKEGSGKSTFQRILEAAFPPSVVGAVSPAVWSREYNVASLAGKRLNVVGELSDDAPIPAAAFKNVTGGNLIEGRHPTHRPFYFTCQAAHLFASNVLPPTTDRTEAFFRRWRIVRFSNRIPEGRVDPDLLAKIIRDEMPAILGRAFRGAERVCHAGRLRTSPAHDAVIAKWKAAANPVQQFLLDAEWVRVDPAAPALPPRTVYDAYRRWASDSGFRNPFGRNHFIDLLDSTGASLGVVIKRTAQERERVFGVELLQSTGVAT